MVPRFEWRDRVTFIPTFQSAYLALGLGSSVFDKRYFCSISSYREYTASLLAVVVDMSVCMSTWKPSSFMESNIMLHLNT
jgi:hypothetical protein